MCYFKQSLLPLIALFLLTIGCKKEQTTTATNLDLDSQIDELLNLASNNQGREYFTLPESDDYLKIPNDPNNPITKEKVELGKLLYHETGLAINPKVRLVKILILVPLAILPLQAFKQVVSKELRKEELVSESMEKEE